MGMTISSVGLISLSIISFQPVQGSVGYVKVIVHNEDLAGIAHITWEVQDPDGNQVSAHDETLPLIVGNHDFWGNGEPITFSKIGTYTLEVNLTNALTNDVFDTFQGGISIGAAPAGWQWWQWALLGGGVVLGGIVIWKVVKIVK
jgi:hypothetical protein